jgi:3-methyladenine DNA glycosylase AlkD
MPLATRTSMNARDIQKRLQALGDQQRVPVLQRFFKTGPGEYGEGDVFVGLRVPALRTLAREYQGLAHRETIRLLHSPIHEARLLALIILVRGFSHGSQAAQQQIYRSYLQNTRFINSWDLVDASAEHIVGAYLMELDKAPLFVLAAADLLWERRIAIMATFHYIKQGEFSAPLHLAHRLLGDPEELIHKAVGWMLREVGKRRQPIAETFLSAHYRTMPRTMLRYAIERFPEDLRQRYLHGKI